MKIIVEVDNQTGALQLGTDVPMPAVQILGYLKIAESCVLDGLKQPEKPAVQAVPAAALRHLNGGPK